MTIIELGKGYAVRGLYMYDFYFVCQTKAKYD